MYTLSLGAFVLGVAVLGAGAAFVVYHRWVADNFGSGLGSYERFKLYAVITCVVGVLIMFNIHSLLLGWIVNLLFGGLR